MTHSASVLRRGARHLISLSQTNGTPPFRSSALRALPDVGRRCGRSADPYWKLSVFPMDIPILEPLVCRSIMHDHAGVLKRSSVPAALGASFSIDPTKTKACLNTQEAMWLLLAQHAMALRCQAPLSHRGQKYFGRTQSALIIILIIIIIIIYCNNNNNMLYKISKLKIN